jgi:alpha-L-fucosidase 2
MYIDPSSPNEDLYVIRILPALPQKIREGKISGIRARGGFELSFEWKDGRLVNAVITSLAGKQARVFYQEKEISLNIAKGETKELNELCKN